MNRRDLIKLVGVITGGSMIGGQFFLSGCNAGGKAAGGAFNETNLALLNEIGETIIPTTNTPGAKAANVAEFMRILVTDCYTQAEQEAFIKGIDEIDVVSNKLHKNDFVKCTPEQRHDILVSLEKEAKEYNHKVWEADKPEREKFKAEKRPYNFVASPKHYYSMMRQMTIAGYFNSEIGAKQALEYLPVPGKFDGAYPYKKGDKAFY